MFGFSFGELCFGEPLTVTPAETSSFSELLHAVDARRVFLIEIYPRQF